jgi:hypothetical protein
MTSTHPDTDLRTVVDADIDWRGFTDRDARDDAITTDLAALDHTDADTEPGF